MRWEITTAMISLIIILTFSVYVSKVNAQSTVLKAIAPEEIGPPGGSFTVSIIAEDIPENNKMFGWEIVLRWTPGLVNCTGETLNYDIWGAGNYLGPWVTKPIDNVNGKYWQSLTGKAPGQPVSGTCWLVNLTFIVIGEPCNDVTFTFELPPGYTAYCLINVNAEEIPHQYQTPTPHIVPEFTTAFMLTAMALTAVSTIHIKKLLNKKV